MKPEVIAIIPARGGSKGLPHKNILPLGKIPLVAWSIQAALSAPSITRVVVSTDDETIAHIALEYGAEVPFLRPTSLAQDRSTIMDSVRHMLRTLQTTEGYTPEAFCTLYPTHPFRAPGLVEKLTHIVLTRHCKVVTAKPLVHTTWSVATPTGRTFLPQTQETPYRPYGLFEGKPLIHSTEEWFLEPIDDPVQLLDIDSAADLKLANLALQAGLFPLDNQA